MGNIVIKIFLIMNLYNVSKKDLSKIGSKASNLCEFIQNCCLVPEGFVLKKM